MVLGGGIDGQGPPVTEAEVLSVNIGSSYPHDRKWTSIWSNTSAGDNSIETYAICAS